MSPPTCVPPWRSPSLSTLLGLSLALASAFAPDHLRAQDSWTIPELAAPIALDGHVTESAWSSVAPLPVVMFAPEYRGRMTERTQIRFAHDGEYLYASARFDDSDPDGIRANARVRDDDAEDDFFNVVIDTFDDGESAVWFLVTPRGNRVDGAITDNGEGPGWNHVEYDSFWDAAAAMTAEGWSAELRIPFSSLRFNRDPDGTVRMGLIAGRYISRKGERHVFPDIRPGPAVAQYKPSLAARVLLREVQEQRALFARPYVLGGVQRLSSVSAETRDLVGELGGDVKIGLTNDITLDASLNTDFAQTEVDDQRVNLTRYSLRYPEKRAFFLERSGTFTLDAGQSVRLFHSRTIGLHRDGTPQRVYGGARLVGRVGGWDVGALDMHTEGPDGIGSTNSGVLRVRRDVLGPESYVGGILTTSRTSGGSLETTLGLDGVLRITGDDYFTFAAGASPGVEPQDLSQESVARAVWERRDHEGWSYRGDVTRIGASFAPALGFVARSGLTSAAGTIGYGWFGGRTFQGSRAALDGEISRRHEDGGIEAARVGLSWRGERRGGGVLEGALDWRQEGLVEPFPLGEAVVPLGTHRFVEGQLFVEAPRGQRMRGSFSLSGGQFYDGYRATGAVSPTWAISPLLEVGGHLEVNRVWFSTRREEYRATVSRLRARVSPNIRLAIHALVQHSSLVDGVIANVRVRYTIRDGSDIFMVFTDGRAEPGDDTVPGGITDRTQRLLLKFSAIIR